MSKHTLKFTHLHLCICLRIRVQSLFSHGNKNEIMKSRPNGTIDIHSSKPEAA